MKRQFIFLKYVSFNMLSMIGLSCYILADTLFIANGVGVGFGCFKSYYSFI